MINQINNFDFVSSINKNQTGVLFSKGLFPEEINSIDILEKVT